MLIDIVTLFPEVFSAYLDTSIIGRARLEKKVQINVHNLRSFATNQRGTVDDTPYGGGAGMVIKVEPIERALAALGKKRQTDNEKIVVLSARGQYFTQQKAADYARLATLTLICGRYEGIDQRVSDYLADEEVSIGAYVLAGGELPALVIAEAVIRLLPGVLGNPESLKEESFTRGGVGEYPQYTKPDEYKGWPVPEVLLSGNHEEIQQWREKQRKSNN